MTRHISGIALVTVLAACCVTHVAAQGGMALPTEWRHWRHAAPIDVPAGADLVAVPLDGVRVAHDPGDLRAHVSAVRFQVDEPAFHRTVRVRTSADGREWRPVAERVIHRLDPSAAVEAGAGTTRELLMVSFDERRDRHWRVEVVNGNDAPLAGAVPVLVGTPRRAVFRPEAGRTYRLIYGNPDAEKPAYDAARLVTDDALASARAAPALVTDDALASARAAPAGPAVDNAAWADPAPWTERHGWVLWVALVAALVPLGAMAIRALRRSGP